MKKLWYLLLIPALAAVAFLVWQNLPSKRYAKHMTKARMFAKENNTSAARLEYQKAYDAQGGYTPYASLEVLELTNRINLQDRNAALALANSKSFVEKNPGIKQGRIILAQLAFQLGETETAFEALNTLIEADPGYFPARLLLTSVRAKQGRLDLAEDQLRYLYEKYPDSVQALLPLAEVLIKQGRVVESRTFLGRLLADNPKHTRARLLMVDSYLRERQVDSAALVLDAWKESEPEHQQAIQVRKARIFSLNNRLPEAKSALAPYLNPKEDNLQALSELAILHVKGGFYDSAISVYRSMAEISPGARQSSENLVFYLHLKNQNPARALEAIKGLQVSAKRNNLLAPLIAAYIAIGQENKVATLLEEQPDSVRKALEDFRADMVPDKDFIGQWALITYYGLNHQDFWVFQAVKDLYAKWPRSELAITLYTGQLSAVGNVKEAAKVLGTLEKPNLTQQIAILQLLSRSGQPEKAIAVAEKLSKENPQLHGINTTLADLWMTKDKAKAYLYYEKELAINPFNAVALNNMAWEYGINQASLEKATPYLDKLKAAKNLDPRILDTIGWILAMNGKLEEGEKYIRNALDLTPDYPAFQFHLAYILNQAGKRDEAKKILDSALSNKLPFEERKEAEKLLAQLG